MLDAGWSALSGVVALLATIGWADDDADCRGALQALHAFVPKEFFNVHLEQDQNSPLRNVKSSKDVMLRSFEPPHTMHTVEVPLLSNVHFLQVHSISDSVGIESPRAEKSLKILF